MKSFPSDIVPFPVLIWKATIFGFFYTLFRVFKILYLQAKLNIEGSGITSLHLVLFHEAIDEMLYVSLYVILLQFQEPVDNIK